MLSWKYELPPSSSLYIGGITCTVSHSKLTAIITSSQQNMPLSPLRSSSFSSLANIVALAVFLLLLTAPTSSAQLSNNFYSKTCPNVFNTVKAVVKSAVAKEPRIGASILRLFFHDCFVDVIFFYPYIFCSSSSLFLSLLLDYMQLIFIIFQNFILALL